MKNWIQKKCNIIYLVVLAVSLVAITIGGIRLYGLLEKGFSVFSVKSSIVKLVIDAVLVLGGMLAVLIGYKIKWMYETRLLLDRAHAEYEEILALLKKENV